MYAIMSWDNLNGIKIIYKILCVIIRPKMNSELPFLPAEGSLIYTYKLAADQ